MSATAMSSLSHELIIVALPRVKDSLQKFMRGSRIFFERGVRGIIVCRGEGGRGGGGVVTQEIY